MNVGGAATFAGAVSVSASQPNFALINTGAGGGTWVSYVVSSTGRYTLQEAGVQDWFTIAKTTGSATFVGPVTTAYLSTVGGNAFNQFGSGTRTKGTLSGQSGEVAFDNGTVDSPGVHFYTGNNANYGIDATSSSGLRLIKNLDETSGTVVASFTDTAADFTGNVSLSTAGKTISIKSGTNAAAGTVTLSGGSATITSTAIDVNTVIVMSVKTSSGTIGDHTPSVKVNAGNAVITGSSSDASTYNWIALKVN
jgi:hypothetical protein